MARFNLVDNNKQAKTPFLDNNDFAFPRTMIVIFVVIRRCVEKRSILAPECLPPKCISCASSGEYRLLHQPTVAHSPQLSHRF